MRRGSAASWCRVAGVAVAVLVAAGGARAQDPDAPEAAQAPEFIRDVVYGHKDGMALVYDVVRPPKPNGAAVVYIVSGGWFSRWEPVDERAARFVSLTDLGYTVMLVHHGSSPRYAVPDAVEDVRRAIRHIRLAAPVYRIASDRIGVLGGSAGGHLALMLGTTADGGDPTSADPVLRQSDRVQAVVAYYPPVDLRPMVGPSERFPALDFPKRLAESVSPIVHVTDDDAPTLLVHGDGDRLVSVRNSRLMHVVLDERGVANEYVEIPGADHGFRDPEHYRKATQAMVAWFERHLGGRAGESSEPR